MKHTAILILGVMVFVLMSSCNKFSGHQHRFLYLAKEEKQSFHASLINGMRKEMAKNNIAVDIMPAQNQFDYKSQSIKIRDVVANKQYAGVMISPNNSEALVEDIHALDREKIPFVFIDTPLVRNSGKTFEHYCGFVGTDNVAVGEMAFKYISEKAKPGSVVLVRGIQTHMTSIERENGFKTALSRLNNGVLKIDGYVVGDWDLNKTQERFAEYMKTKPHAISAILAYNDHMALGVSNFYDQHPELDRPVIVGVDGSVVGQKGLLEHKIDAIVVQTPDLMGIEGLRLMTSCATSPRVIQKDVYTPLTLLATSPNLQPMQL